MPTTRTKKSPKPNAIIRDSKYGIRLHPAAAGLMGMAVNLSLKEYREKCRGKSPVQRLLIAYAWGAKFMTEMLESGSMVMVTTEKATKTKNGTKEVRLRA